jgi:protoporphyrinogen oxidase
LSKKIAVIGAGPAGLTAAYEILKNSKDYKVDLYESNSYPGGMAASIKLWNQTVDLGPHRFFSSDARVNKFWLEIIDGEYRMIKRKTRILYENKFFNYPLKPLNSFINLGLVKSVECVLSYFYYLLFPKKNISNFENWAINKFGMKLYKIFFKFYSEKLWGINCRNLSSDFATQRIKKFNLYEAIKSFFIFNNNKHKTLVDEFAYPINGTGYFYQKLSMLIKKKNGGKIFYNQCIKDIKINVKNVEISNDKKKYFKYDHLISTMPITNLIKFLKPSKKILISVDNLRFRNTMLVYLKVDKKNIFSDQWIYVNSNNINCGRITNFSNWKLKNNNKFTILCLEYWFNDNDKIWIDNDKNKILKIAKSDVNKLNLFHINDIKDIKTIKISKCYPIYYKNYKYHLSVVIKFLKKFKNITLLGRYGSFKYNNQDHSILMGLLAGENFTKNKKHDLWSVNSDYEYQEKTLITKTGLKKI